MKLVQVKIRNFKSFGPQTVTLDMQNMIVLLGANGAGKTALLEALLRVFGASEFQRTVGRDDFHVPHGQVLEDLVEQGAPSLRIEALFQLSDADSPIRKI